MEESRNVNCMAIVRCAFLELSAVQHKIEALSKAQALVSIYATAIRLEQFQLNHSIQFIKEAQNIVNLSNKSVTSLNNVVAINKR